jgi:hypothetical protein
MTSPQPPQDWRTRFKNLKIDLDRNTATSDPLNEVNVDLPTFGIEKLQESYRQFIAWFSGIPSSGKLLAIGAGGLLGLTLIKTVFQLVTSLITLSVLGTIFYLAYRFWILPKSGE